MISTKTGFLSYSITAWTKEVIINSDLSWEHFCKKENEIDGKDLMWGSQIEPLLF